MKTVLDKATELKQVCATIAEQTDQNDHTGAKITIAKFAQFRDFTKIFEAIKAIQDVEGCMPGELSDYRCRKGLEMMQRIKDYFPERIYTAIQKSL